MSGILTSTLPARPPLRMPDQEKPLPDRKTLQSLRWWMNHRLDRVEWPQGESYTLNLYHKDMHCRQYGSGCQQGATRRCGACVSCRCLITGTAQAPVLVSAGYCHPATAQNLLWQTTPLYQRQAEQTTDQHGPCDAWVWGTTPARVCALPLRDWTGNRSHHPFDMYEQVLTHRLSDKVGSSTSVHGFLHSVHQVDVGLGGDFIGIKPQKA